MVWRHDLFLAGLLVFAVAHVFYLRALGLSPTGGGPTAASCLIIAGTAFLILYPGVLKVSGPIMLLPVVMYMALIFTMTWRSVVALQALPGFGSFCACVGAAMFSVSDFLIAFDKWVSEVPRAPLVVMVTYYTAQLGLALSVPCFTGRGLKAD